MAGSVQYAAVELEQSNKKKQKNKIMFIVNSKIAFVTRALN